ncbi:MAG: deoxyguanosinetriphosphate triphosphohydrolase, partial [Coriobacteriia bacterium]
QSLRIVEVLEYEGKGLNLTWEVRDGISHHTGGQRASTLEGQIVAIADRVAYVNHDIDDAIRGGVISEAELPVESTEVLGHNHGARITTMVHDMVGSSLDSDEIRMSPRVWDAMMALREWLFANVYFSERAKSEAPKAYHLVQELFFYYLAHPEELPEEYAPVGPDCLVQSVVDYVAGMTDRFAIRTYERLFLPTRWRM